jgi:glycine cleavage system aminomethyltransferase T
VRRAQFAALPRAIERTGEEVTTLPIGLTDLGTTLEVQTPTERVPAVVVEKPFIDPKKETPKQAVGPAPG